MKYARVWLGGCLLAGLLGLSALWGSTPSAWAGDDKAPSKVNPRRGADLRLPEVGTVGVEPQAKRRVVISVTRVGDVFVSGREDRVSLQGLVDHLTVLAGKPAMRAQDGTTTLQPLLDLDASLPWFIAQWMMQACAMPSVGVSELAFGVTTRGNRERGALSVTLPQNIAVDPSVPSVVQISKARVKVFARPKVSTDPRMLFAAFMALPAAMRKAVVCEFVNAPPYGGRVPWRYMAQLMDAAASAGIPTVLFDGGGPLPLVRRGAGGGLPQDPDYVRQQVAMVRKAGSDWQSRIKISLGWVDELSLKPRAIPARGRLDKIVGFRLNQMDLPALMSTGSDPFLASVPLPLPGARTGGAGGPTLKPRGVGTAFPLRGAVLATPLAPKVPERARTAAQKALQWLAAHQSSSGAWEAAGFGDWCDGKALGPDAQRPKGKGKAEYDIGLTGLVLQAFLAAGHTNRTDSPYSKVVGRGLRYLKMNQDRTGCFGSRGVEQWTYNHALASIAMVEAYGMTGSPIFKGSAQRAIRFTEEMRNPFLAWRYGVRTGENDTSISSWMTMVLRSAMFVNEAAEEAGKPAPLVVDTAGFEGMSIWLRRVTDIDYGRVGYIQRGTGPARPRDQIDRFPVERSESMTAVAIFLRRLIHPWQAGHDPDWQSMNNLGLRLMRKLPPDWSERKGSIDLYYWYWGTLAMWQVGGPDWLTWEKELHRALLQNQRDDGNYCGYRGSWDPKGPWGLDGGRVYATAMNCLDLLVYERYPRVP